MPSTRMSIEWAMLSKWSFTVGGCKRARPTRFSVIGSRPCCWRAGAVPALAQEAPRHGGELVFVVPAEPPSYDAHREETFAVVHPAAPALQHPAPGRSLRQERHADGRRSRRGVVGVEGRAHVHVHPAPGRTLPRRQRADGAGRQGELRQDHLPAPGIASNRRGEYLVVEAVEARGPSTVVFRLRWAVAVVPLVAGLALQLDLQGRHPGPRHAAGTSGTSWVRGPFLFVEYVKGSHWIGRKNPDYWDRGKPYLDGYRAIFVQDSAAQVAAIRGQRAMIQFRGFSPPERDTLVAGARAEDHRAGEPLGVRQPARHQPRAEALRRPAGAAGPHPRARSLAGRAGARRRSPS